MTFKTHTVEVEFWGDYGCFTDPFLKAERMSYPIPTHSAIRGMLESIYWHPYIKGVSGFYWQVEKIELLSPIKYMTYRTNELVKGRGKGIEPLIIEKLRTQRFNYVLRDIHYRVYAHMVAYDNTPKESMIKSREIFRRRVKKEQCYYQPAFGRKRFIAHFGSSKNPGEIKNVIDITENFGLMLYDTFNLLKPTPKDASEEEEFFRSVFNASVEKGVICYPEFTSDKVLRNKG
jgi:CRISPR-associated protein Cas5d